MPRRVLVTGASRGIGKAIAEKYRSEGWEVLAPTREELTLGESGSAYKYKEKHGYIDCLVNSAAVNEKDYGNQETLNINYGGTYDLVYQFIKHMAARQWGRVVLLGSCSALFGRGEKRASYSASKAACDAAMRCWASTYGDSGILVNTVCPGFVDTDMTKNNLPPFELDRILDAIPVGRLAQPEEIAEFVYFLGSEKNTYITGQVIPIDGGYTSCR